MTPAATAVRPRSRTVTAADPRRLSFGLAPLLALLAAVGLLIIALGNNAARLDEPGAQILFWAGLSIVYAPIAHWVWSPDGWLAGLGVLDFAGGTVVHLSSGVAALVAALFIGRRLGLTDGEHATEPHDVPMTVLGAGLLWFGWFGFNAGSALAADGLAATAFVTTNTAAAMAAITWVTISWLHKGTPSVLGAAVGAVAGLVAITPAAGFVTPAAAVLIGFGVAVVCYGASLLRLRSRIDDALDVFAVHGVGGAFGALATGVFATVAVNVARMMLFCMASQNGRKPCR